MFALKISRIPWLIRYSTKQAILLDYPNPATSMVLPCKYNFHLIRKYCSEPPIMFKNQALTKYVVNLLREYERHEGGKFKGMKPSIIQRKIAIVKKLINDINIANDNIKSLNELRSEDVNDDSFMKSLNKELEEYENVIEIAENKIISELLPEDNNENCNEIMIEISAGAGGQEAMLFARELHNMYCNYLVFKTWDWELSDLEETDLGGIKHSTIMISGKTCYKLLRYEGGVHRVQRIPKTEKYGRMQTSTVSVAILPQPSEIEVNIEDKDLRVETKTARGPGGQHVNKIETAVRIHHLPTGIIVDCQVHKSQSQNKSVAMQKLRTKLYELECERQDSTIKNLRKIQIGTASRNEKVRTYNFPQDRITDHRFNKTIRSVERYFQGEELFDNFLKSLLEQHYEQERQQFLNQLELMQ